MAHDLSAEELLAAGRGWAISQRPYLVEGVRRLIPTPKPGTKTFAVSAKMIMHYDPEVIRQWTVKKIATGMVHEQWHVLMRHHERAEKMREQQGGQFDSEVWNIAADCEINSLMREEGCWDFIPGVCYPENYQLPPNNTTEENYLMLLKKKQQGKLPQPGTSPQCGHMGDPQPGGGSGPQQKQQGSSPKGGAKPTPKPQPGSSGPSQPQPGQNAQKSPPAPGSGSGDTNGQDDGQSGPPVNSEGSGHIEAGRCGSCGGNEVPGLEDAESEKDGRGTVEIESVRGLVAQAIIAEQGRGRSNQGSSHASRWADMEVKPPLVHWTSRLARILQMSAMFRGGPARPRWDRPSRRQESMGTKLTDPRLPRTVVPIPRILFAFDTSGSVGTAQLQQAAREAQAVLKLIGASAYMVAIDTEISSMSEVKNLDDIAKNVTGGGGTDFRPVFEFVDKKLKQDPIDAVIFFTDGDGPAPERSPKGYHVIWCLINGYHHPSKWGEYIEVKL